jgi:hypothetical protein
LQEEKNGASLESLPNKVANNLQEGSFTAKKESGMIIAEYRGG